MSPRELAVLHPRLYHLTNVDSWALISKIGLLSTVELLKKFEVDQTRFAELTKMRRSKCVNLNHKFYGNIQISDNLPLSEKKLLNCLDDGLHPSQWLEMLNSRVFFWVDRKKVDGLSKSRGGSVRNLELLEFDTFSLVSNNFHKTEITPFNTGNTNHTAARRGIETFSRLAEVCYKDWRRKRMKKKPDNIAEISIVDGITDVSKYLVSRVIVS